MSRARRTAILDAEGVAGALEPRRGLVVERPAGDGPGPERPSERVGVFELEAGALHDYRRTVEVSPPDEDGRFRVTQTVEFQLAVPYFGFLFVPLFRMWARRIGPEPAQVPWWAPPDRLDVRGSSALGTLCAVAVVFGYLNTLFTQTVTFAGDEFGSSRGAEGVAGAVVRVGGVLALVLVALADRRGRRWVLLLTLVCGCGLASTGAIVPSLPWLALSQLLARAFANALLLVVGIMAVEEMPAGSRAYAVSLLAMSAGLGAGVCVIALRLADIGTSGWRLLYLVPLLGLFLVRGIARRLPETRRFVRTHVEAAVAGHGGRLLLLAASAFLVNLFVAPNSQFSNRFLHDELGYSGGRIALITVCTGTPAGLGIILGGRLADVRGRRRVGAVGTSAGTVFGVLYYFAFGWPVWLWALLSAMTSAVAVPALSVYGPELFPTSLRGRANGVINVLGLAGSAIGLAGVGVLADRFDRVGPAMAIAAVGPLALAVLVLLRYPETAHLELEDINPEDRAPPPTLPA